MSIWKSYNNRKVNKLSKNIDVDILIIGAGITGMTLAYLLKDKNVCVVDARKIGFGVTLRSTAKINYFQGIVYTKILDVTDNITASSYLNSQIYAMKKLKKIIKKEKIACDLEKVSSYVFPSNKGDIHKLDREVKFLLNNKIKVKEVTNFVKLNKYKLYGVDDTYVFNPLKYLDGLYNILIDSGVSLYENTNITKIEKIGNSYICATTKNFIKAKIVVVATQYPYFLFPLLLPLKSSLEKSYIIVSKVNTYHKYTYISTSDPIYSTRFYKDKKNIYKISLGKSYNLYKNKIDTECFCKLQKEFDIDNKDIVYKYTNTDIITSDYMPYIGSIKNNMYISCGYNTWGITNGILGACIISDRINNKKNKYDIFNPYRINISNIVKFPKYIYGSIKSYFKYKQDNIKVIKINGQNIGVYNDSKGTHMVYIKCPHMGCRLRFNEVEKTWDCPCHSSRFNIDGKCIKGPSNYDISFDLKKNK